MDDCELTQAASQPEYFCMGLQRLQYFPVLSHCPGFADRYQPVDGDGKNIDRNDIGKKQPLHGKWPDEGRQQQGAYGSREQYLYKAEQAWPEDLDYQAFRSGLYNAVGDLELVPVIKVVEGVEHGIGILSITSKLVFR
jgi:hypothetical protein